MDPTRNLRGSDVPVYNEDYMFFAKPNEVGLQGRQGFFTNTNTVTNTYNHVYTPPGGYTGGKFVKDVYTSDLIIDAKDEKADKLPLDERVDGTFSEGTLVQLLSRGPQDVFLTYNPNISLFKRKYKRYTNFAIENFEERFSTTVQFGTRNICQLSKNGDLVGNMCFRFTLPNLGIAGGTWAPTIGYRIFSTIRMRIGDTIVQGHDRVWYDIDDKMFCDSTKILGLNELIKRDVPLSTDQEWEVIVPLKFFCCKRNTGKQQFLPILNMNTNINVYLEFNLSPLSSLVTLPTGSTLPDIQSLDATVWVDYLFLDDTEKYRFAQDPCVYLIEQTFSAESLSYATTTNGQTYNKKDVYIELRELNKPTKYVEIIAYRQGDLGFNYIDIIQKSTFYLNSDEQFQSRSGEYFTLVQPYQHFKRSDPASNVSTFSFALDAGSFQPNGYLNFAPYVRTKFAFDINPQTEPTVIRLFAVCLNWIKFESGMCKLLFN
ncbi:Major capsid protein VP54 [Only Syngen Nebraska virus 5]|uniref:Major capsid protein VP54 n=1 Tax=Only Syngen Nebraska virus 5 TaxID=1917232 RepID=UPI000901C75A|nr:Major capsid protein VP54 [Only Syngen Nebraska virus 5]APC25695.1 Major capsid protein VP54 [Only Syngen Nebraska virus 5]